MDEHTAAPGIAPAAATEPRISTLLADRPCGRCMFNLVGQSIIRERHYGMLVVRCPECGTIASLQEYPLLGRWANRWAALAAAVWFLSALQCAAGIAGVMFGFTMGTLETTSQTLADVIGKKHHAYQTALQVAQGVPQNQNTGWWNIDPQWWDTLDKAALIKEAGGWGGAVQWWGFLIWIIAFPLLFLLASVWAVGAAHRRGWRLLLTYVPMILLAVMFFGAANVGQGWMMSAYGLSIRLIWPVVAPVCAVLAVLPLVLGAFLGRPLTRLFIVLWLPPRLRVPLSFLWICDGKSPPKPSW